MAPCTVNLTSDLGQIVCYSLCVIVVKCNHSLQESLVDVSNHNEIWNSSAQRLLSRQCLDMSLLDWPDLSKVLAGLALS